MTPQYLIKYITSEGKYTYVDENVDIFGLKGIRLGGVLFDETNIVTVSGTNSLSAVSGVLQSNIDSVSGSLSSDLASVSGSLFNRIMSVSGASSLRDDSQDLQLLSVSSSLQSQVNAIVNDQAKEETYQAVSGQRTFSVSGFTFDPDPSNPDIKVYRNGTKVKPSLTGVSSVGDYHKLNDYQVFFHYDVAAGTDVTIRDERTGGGGGGGTDLENITVNPKPITNGSKSLGDGVKAWNSVYLADVVSGGIYQLQVSGGVLVAAQVV